MSRQRCLSIGTLLATLGAVASDSAQAVPIQQAFTTTTGALSVLLDSNPIGRLLKASDAIAPCFLRTFLEIDDPAGTSVLLDSIVFPGLLDDNFDSLAKGTTAGNGMVRLTSVPGPAAALLFLTSLLGLVVVGRLRRPAAAPAAD